MTRRRTPGQPGNGLADGVSGGLRKRSLFPVGRMHRSCTFRECQPCRCRPGPRPAPRRAAMQVTPGQSQVRSSAGSSSPARIPRYRNPWTEPHASFCPVCSVSWRESAFFYHQEKIPDQTIPYQNYRRNHFKKLIQLPMHCFVADQRLSWEPGPCRSAPDAEKLPIQETRIANSAVRR